jgi:UDP-3-O-[3-hydroxymyristoyl] glucosamine N-acyltransferase
MKLEEIATKLSLPIFGDPQIEVYGVGDLESIAAVKTDSIYYIASKKHLARYPHYKDIKIVLTTDKLKDNFSHGLIVEEANLKITFIELLKLFEKRPSFGTGISPKASIHPSAKIGSNVTILDFAVIMENVEIGDNCEIHPNVVIEPGAKIGEGTVLRANVVIGYNCIVGKHNLIHSSVVIGADGFGFHDQNGIRYKIPQIGNVVLGDHVEIGASSTIDRATIESTIVGDHTKLDDQIHIGHNCRVGSYVYMAGTAGLAGSVVLEDGVIVGGQSAIAEHLRVGKGAIVMGLTGVTKDVEAKTMVFGTPARSFTEMLRISAVLGELPDLLKRVKALEKEK